MKAQMSEGVEGTVGDITGFMRIRGNFEGFLVWKDFSIVRGKSSTKANAYHGTKLQNSRTTRKERDEDRERITKDNVPL